MSAEENFTSNEMLWFQANVLNIKGKGEFSLPPAYLEGFSSEWARFIRENNLDHSERTLLCLAMVQYLDPLLIQNLVNEDNSFRLIQCNKTGVLLPTGETFISLVMYGRKKTRMEAYQYLSTDHLFYKKGIISFGEVNEGVANHFGVIKISGNYRDLFLFNKHTRPRFSTEFPAHLLESSQEWEDLILSEYTRDKLDQVKSWLVHEQKLRKEWGMDKQMKPGFRCLFFGPSGTGKTVTATLLGKQLNRDVYRVDLSTVVSKYIGETSKNLNALFNTAEDKEWVLFFDEGDALFGKRQDMGKVEDKNAHYSNQEVAFLLQRVENYRGLVIVATNLKQNLDPAFMRRFQCMIPFDVPDENDRMRIWKQYLPKSCTLEPEVKLDFLARKHPVPASAIVNICNQAAVLTASRGKTSISAADIEYCIREELFK